MTSFEFLIKNIAIFIIFLTFLIETGHFCLKLTQLLVFLMKNPHFGRKVIIFLTFLIETGHFCLKLTQLLVFLMKNPHFGRKVIIFWRKVIIFRRKVNKITNFIQLFDENHSFSVFFNENLAKLTENRHFCWKNQHFPGKMKEMYDFYQNFDEKSSFF